MAFYEYKVVAAPKRSQKARGLKTGEDRFAFTLESTMNDLAAEGWEYWRTDTLPSEERSGLTSRTTVYQHLMVFRRETDEEEIVARATTDAHGRPRISATAPATSGRVPTITASRPATTETDED